MTEYFQEILSALRLSNRAGLIMAQFITLIIIAGASFIIKMIVSRAFKNVIKEAVAKTKNKFDDELLATGITGPLLNLVPLMIVHYGIGIIFDTSVNLAGALKRITLSLIVLTIILAFKKLLDAIDRFYHDLEISKKTPIRGYIQLVKILLAVIGAVLIISTLLNISPWGIMSSIGAMTAIILLVFRDSILGLVASIQLHSNNMLNIGDWVEMPKYNADGDVIEITLTTIKVRNWDKTITSIPTYAFVSDSFKNWRGMIESGTRRIKRVIYIDLNTIRFCDNAMIEEFKKISLIEDYIGTRQKEIAEYNREQGVDQSAVVNGRRMTNIGTFRAYVSEYLKHHPCIRADETLMVRHLQPEEHGLPLEIYAFTSDTAWTGYEAIQADIFDHIIAVVPFFGLRLFQEPGGVDFQALAGKRP